jgi:Plasmid pRiA4b ORF-3-like protein
MKDLIIRVSITLLDVDPAIWRRIEAPANVTLEGLHDVIQVVMGWADHHLHHFQVGSLRYGAPTPDDIDIQDGRKLKLSRLIDDGERAFEYVYDYGDEWRCVVVLEATAPMIPGFAYPRLVEGARRGPPEDVGGPWGFGELLEAIADHKHERHAELLEWCGGDFDPQQLNITEINGSLASLAPRKNTRRKTAKPTAHK